MSNEKDGTEVPPPDEIPDGVPDAVEDSDVTNVKSLPTFAASDEDDGDVVTQIKPLDEIQTQVRESSAVRRFDAPRLPGVPASVAELQADSGPHAVSSVPSAPPPTPVAAEGEEEIETVDDADVETVDDDAVLEEELADASPTVPGVLDSAMADAANMLAEGGHARLIALYEKELEVLARSESDKGRTALYQHEIGELTESRAGDEGAAVKAYAKALQSDATLKPNLWAIRRVFERRALWPNLQKLLDAEIRFAKTPEEKAELYVEKGELLEDRLNDPTTALDCFNRAVEASASSLPAWMALEKIHTRARDLGQLARVWRGMIDATAEPPRKVALLIDLGRLQDSIGGGPEASRALLQEALAVGADGGRVLDELERLSERSGNKEELLAVLDERARAADRRAGRAADRAAAARGRAAGGVAAAAGGAGTGARRRRRRLELSAGGAGGGAGRAAHRARAVGAGRVARALGRAGRSAGGARRSGTGGAQGGAAAGTGRGAAARRQDRRGGRRRDRSSARRAGTPRAVDRARAGGAGRARLGQARGAVRGRGRAGQFRRHADGQAGSAVGGDGAGAGGGGLTITWAARPRPTRRSTTRAS